MVNFVAVGAGVAGSIGLWSLAKPTFNGNNRQNHGPYDNRIKRAAYATAAGITGVALSYLAPVALPVLAGGSSAKTILASAAFAMTAPGVVSRVVNGDQGHRRRLGVTEGGPYSSFSNRLFGHISEGVAASSLVYLATQYPEQFGTAVSLSGSALYNAASLGLSATWEITKGAVNLTGNALYYGFQTAATIASGIDSMVNGVATAVETASNATSTVWGYLSRVLGN